MALDNHEQLAFAIVRLDQERQRQQREIVELRAQLEALVDLLAARGTLNEGHKRHLARMMQRSANAEPKVRLHVYVDKYATPSPDVDCAALFSLCQARCCRFKIELTAADVEEGKLKWNLEEPYLLRKELDGLCTHMDRATGGCRVYEVRPATCREYDCRADKRVWIDYEKRIPAPILESLDLPLPPG